MSATPVRKAIIPAAGFGTRFLPIAKAVPKEMLPIVDRPVIAYVIEEAVRSGITDILLVISREKRAIEEYFHSHPALEAALTAKGKTRELGMVREPDTQARLHFIWQQDMKGLGDAVCMGRSFAAGEPCAVLLGDTIVEAAPGQPPVTRQLLDIHAAHGGSVVAIEEVPAEKVSRYGIAGGDWLEPGIMKVNRWVEKPSLAEAPSRMAIASRYVLTAGIFDCLARAMPGKAGEIQLTDAMKTLLEKESMFGLQFAGTRHDIGNPADFIKANVHFGLQRPEMAAAIREYLSGLAGALNK